MATDRRLIRFAQDAEDVASGLHTFCDGLPRSAPAITRIISELFAISAVLRELGDGRNDVRAVQYDFDLVFPTLRKTLDAAFDMFAKSRDRSIQATWEDLTVRMERDENAPLLDRLEWYHDFLKGQQDILLGYRPRDLGCLRRQIVPLLAAQEQYERLTQRRSIEIPVAPSPRAIRPRAVRMETLLSPTSPLDDWNDPLRRRSMAPPPAPDAPLPMPTSPTFTSSSSQTLNSSQTSYSSDTAFAPVQPVQPGLVHWAQDVFDGQNPGTMFRASYQLNEVSDCHGNLDSSALGNLVEDGFIRALQISFDNDQFWVRLYYRPLDSRSRILIMLKDGTGQQIHFCTPLTNLKVIRDGSSLQLCRMRRGGMVLFYCTFVAMKRQDRRPVEHQDLLDDFELEGTPEVPEEELLFAAKIKDQQMVHILRFYRDQGSRVARLEASASRGPMENVPLWTAFVTRYLSNHDDAWAEYEGGGLVNLAALRPPPYMFLSGYEPPKNREGLYTLQFVSDTDARHFVETWTGMCR